MTRRVRFKNCPVGLFWCGDTLAVMTEYSTVIPMDSKHSPGKHNRDAYIVETGEYFAGGNISYESRDMLMVTPMPLSKVPKPWPPDADIDGLMRRLRECDPSEYLQEEAAALIEALRAEQKRLMEIVSAQVNIDMDYALADRLRRSEAAEKKLAEIEAEMQVWKKRPVMDFPRRVIEAILARSTSQNGG